MPTQSLDSHATPDDAFNDVMHGLPACTDIETTVGYSLHERRIVSTSETTELRRIDLPSKTLVHSGGVVSGRPRPHILTVLRHCSSGDIGLQNGSGLNRRQRGETHSGTEEE